MDKSLISNKFRRPFFTGARNDARKLPYVADPETREDLKINKELYKEILKKKYIYNMDRATFEDYVVSRYQNQLDYYDKTSGRNQRKYKRFQWVLIMLTALTPVFAALKTAKIGGEAVDLSILVLITSTIVAILTTGLKTFNYQELWVKARTTNEKLKPELYYYNFGVGEYGVPGVDKESVFVTRVEAILGSEHRDWPAIKNLQNNADKGK